MGKIMLRMGKNFHNHIEIVCYLYEYSQNVGSDWYNEKFR